MPDDPLVLTVGGLIATAATLYLALGPIVSSVIESFKPTGLVRSGWAGVYALSLSTLLGIVFGLVVALQEGGWIFLLFGAIVGFLGPGAGAVRSAQAQEGITARTILEDPTSVMVVNNSTPTTSDISRALNQAVARENTLR